MNRDDTDAALAHQQELERRQMEEEMLGGDDYLAWMIQLLEQARLKNQEKRNEVPSESNDRL